MSYSNDPIKRDNEVQIEKGLLFFQKFLLVSRWSRFLKKNNLDKSLQNNVTPFAIPTKKWKEANTEKQIKENKWHNKRYGMVRISECPTTKTNYNIKASFTDKWKFFKPRETTKGDSNIFFDMTGKSHFLKTTFQYYW